MASSTSARRVLSSLDVNTPTSHRAGTPLRNSIKAGTVNIGEEPGFAKPLFNGSFRVENDDSVGARGDVADGDTQGSPKRRKRYVEDVDEDVLLATRAVQVGLEDRPSKSDLSQRRSLSSPRRGPDINISELSSPLTSPNSSFDASANDMNDTQNTSITEPDLDPFLAANLIPTRPPPLVLTHEQLREKARAMRLRLSLASYKVRTNQVDIPISRLEIRLSQHSQRKPILHRTSSNTSQRSRTALPSAPAETLLPPVALSRNEIHSSPPAPIQARSVLGNRGGREEFATPVLPKFRLEGGLSGAIPDLSPCRAGREDVTSSVVKGRAADGLLSLMRCGGGD